MRRVVIKIGSSVVADDGGHLRERELNSLIAEVARFHNDGLEFIIVTSGAIASGIRLLSLSRRPRAIDELQAASAVGQGELYRSYESMLRERGVVSAQILLTFFDMSARSHYLNVRQTLLRLFSWNIVPIINENDTTTTDEISFGDNDFLAAQVAILTQADLLLLLTNTDGLYTGDPKLHPDAPLISDIEDADEIQDLDIGHSTSFLGSGGMRSKVVAAEMATAAGIPAVIANGLKQHTLTGVLGGERVGTTFHAGSVKATSFKLWLKYAKPTKGKLEIDAGAAKALTTSGTSLLPVGITAIHGDFDAGDAVDLFHNQTNVGKGISSYSADELQRIKGKKSSEIKDILHNATTEAIHRDYLVLSIEDRK